MSYLNDEVYIFEHGEYYEAHRNYHGTLDVEAFGN